MDNGDIKGSEDRRGTCSCWNDRTNKQKNWIKVAVVLIVLFVLAGIFFGAFYERVRVCTSNSCIKASEDIQQFIDTSEDPCNDFYKFSCGRFLREIQLDFRGPVYSSKNVTHEEMQDRIKSLLQEPIQNDDPVAFNQAKKFFKSCMNESAVNERGLQDVREILSKIGGWPTLYGHDGNSNFQWTDAIHVLRAVGIDFDLFFSVKLEVDEENPKKYIIAINHATDIYSNISQNIKNKYLEYMVDLALQFNARKELALKDQIDVLNFLLSLARITEDTKNSEETSTKLRISDLQHKMPSINWINYLDGILRTAFVNENDVIKVSSLIYLNKLEKLLLVTNKRTIANFISWHTLQYLINYLPSKILERAYNYLRNVNGIIMVKPRENICLKAVEDKLYPVLAVAYIEHYFDFDTVGTKVINLIQEIKNQIQENFKKVDWLDYESKRESMNALMSGTQEIVTPQDVIMGLDENKIYNDVEVWEDRFLLSALKLNKEQLDNHYRKYRKNVKYNWLSKKGFITSFDAIYLPQENILRYPNGLFQGIFYDPDRPQYMNFAGLGTVAAHEISHIFMDSESSEIFGQNMRSWWTDFSMRRYKKKQTCLLEQYRGFVLPETHTKFNPAKTIDEDMADLAGMKVAYDAYVNYEKYHGKEPILPNLPYTAKQLFWISAARTHCTKYSSEYLKRLVENGSRSPEPFRVNGPLQNIKEFSADFDCVPGTKMNPENKCYIW